MASSAWAGRLFFGRRRLVYAGFVGTTTEHAHHAHQFVLSCGEPLCLRARAGAPAAANAFFIPANAPHAIVTASMASLILHVDPDDAAGRALRALEAPDAPAAAWAAAARPLLELNWEEPEDWDAAEALAGTLVTKLAGAQARPVIRHAAVKRAVKALPELVRQGAVRLEAVAERSGVSSSRLAHLFAGEVGIAMRPYVLWLRLHLASEAIAAGATLTVAAHEAGFADAAHFSRVCRRMFGISPSMVNVVEWIPPPEHLLAVARESG